ncbi:glycosyltransferase family 2 protein [uncultured Desulfuromusa sp.]|uniref:glycosyltransferase family 2 protein n=1 Tax=uncultured Desulfuromusa sp. TaxID=219183 RepID=UPI002AA703CF|nr:glycosyltransferase family 2 protein [uncultured Desulfuromusa sp.]
MDPEVSVVVPLYNEELVIAEMYERLTGVLEHCGSSYEIILVNDGSRDKTLQMATDICQRDKRVKLLSFSRNFGHQIAITAGMDKAAGNAIVVIDADLQDPPEVIPEMIKKWREGFQVVYGVRSERKGESWFKLFTASAFYRVLKRMTSVDIPVDTGDFRLMDRRVMLEFLQMREQARFVRGMVSWVGFRQGEVLYSRDERFAGETKYPFKKMLKFAIDGMLSFSQIPLKISSAFGMISAVISFIFMIYGIFVKFFYPEQAIPGWASLFSAVLFIGGVQLICIGVLGEYIGRIHEEIKKRPLYIIDEKVNFE